MSDLPVSNFWVFYQVLIERAIAINFVNYNCAFRLGDVSQKRESCDRLNMLRELEKLSIQKSGIANKLKIEKQMGR